MSDIATTRARAGEHAAGVQVSDYVGQPAAEAARAVRRVGLLPGVEPSFGCEPELTGLVVAQEPVSGEQLARNGILTLYIAAQGAPVERDRERQDPERFATQQTTQDASATPDLLDAFAQARRPRKRGRRRGGAQRRFDVPPEPTVRAIDGYPWEVPAPAQPATEQNDQPRAEPAPTWQAASVEVPESDEHVPSYETLMAGELFARHADDTAAWASVYPRSGKAPAWQRALKWVRRRPVLTASVSALIAVWVAVALLGALGRARADSRLGGTLPRTVLTPQTAIARKRPAQHHPTSSLRAGADVALRPDTHTAQRRRPRAARQQIEPTAAPVSTPATATQPEARPAPATGAQPSPVPAPAPAQSGGGPFSP
jgi:hypothetical protein